MEWFMLAKLRDTITASVEKDEVLAKFLRISGVVESRFMCPNAKNPRLAKIVVIVIEAELVPDTIKEEIKALPETEYATGPHHRELH